MKELIFLPDRDGRDEIGDASGFVRVGASADALRQLAARLPSPAAPVDAAVDGTAWRSALTLALLTQCLVLPAQRAQPSVQDLLHTPVKILLVRASDQVLKVLMLPGVGSRCARFVGHADLL